MKKLLLQQLTQEIQNCKKCSLWKTRNRPLVGEGSIISDVVFIGEAPGYREDLTGQAFVGNAGNVLNRLLQIANLKRDQIYITNILKCHPPKNKNPLPSEINACMDYLFRQLKIIQPKVIFPLGKFATMTVFSKIGLYYTNISNIHGKLFKIKASYGLVKIIPMYHPAAACYNPSLIKILQNDMQYFTKMCWK